MDELLTSIEKVKGKLTSKEYKKIMEKLQQVHEKTKKVVFEIHFASCAYNLNAHNVIIQPRLKKLVMTQKNIPYTNHVKQHDLYQICNYELSDMLNDENYKTLEHAQDQYFVSKQEFEDTCIPNVIIDYDTGYNHVYIKFLEGDMDPE